jgi:hypothetical protein
MEFKENELINEVLGNYYNTFQIMLDTPDFVPEKINSSISNYLYKRLKKRLKGTRKEYKKFLRLKKQKVKEKQKK